MNFPGRIHGLSDERRPYRAGKIKIGERVEVERRDGSKYWQPKKLDHFRLAPEGPDAHRIQSAWHAVYGDAPRKLQIMLPGNELATVFPQAYKCWRQSHLWCTGDNEWAQRRTTGTDGKWDGWQTVPCNDGCPYRAMRTDHDENCRCGECKQRTCKPEGTLHILLPDLEIGLATFELRCAKTSIVRLNTALDSARMVYRDLALREFTLHLIEEKTPKGATMYVLDLELPRVSLRQIAEARHTPQLGPAPDDQLDEDEPADLEGYASVDPAADDGAEPPAAAPAQDAPAEPATGTHSEDEARFIRGQCYGLISQIEPTRRQEMGRRLSEADGDVRDLTELREELRCMAREAGGGEAAPPAS